MNESKISVRYSKALFGYASDLKKLDQVFADMSLVAYIFENHPEFSHFIASPIIKPSKKQEILLNIFKDSMQMETLNFLKLLSKNKREDYLHHITRNFISLYKKAKNIKSATLKTAVTLSVSVVKKIEEALTNSFKSQIEMSTVVDENILGGFIIRLDDIQYDASIATKLSKIKRELLTQGS